MEEKEKGENIQEIQEQKIEEQASEPQPHQEENQIIKEETKAEINLPQKEGINYIELINDLKKEIEQLKSEIKKYEKNEEISELKKEIENLKKTEENNAKEINA